MNSYYKKLEKKVVDYLVGEECAQAVIFLGSRAVGDFKPNSDWDAVIFTKKKKKIDTKERKAQYGIEDEDLDIQFVPPNQKFEWRKFGLKLRYHKIMYDPKGLAKRLVTEAAKEYKKGPLITKEWAQARKAKATRYMKKFDDNLADKKYGELFNRMCWHFTEDIFNWWFHLRKEWPLRPQQKFAYIKKKDPLFHEQLKKIYSDKTSYKVKVQAFKKIHKLLFESKYYRKLVK